jgi:hypothetical protein
LALWREPRQPSYIDSMPNLQWLRIFLGVAALAGFTAAGWYLIDRHRVAPPLLPVAAVPQTQAAAPRVMPSQAAPVAPATPAQTSAVAIPATEPHLAVGIPMLEKHPAPPTAPSGGAVPNLVTGLPSPRDQRPPSPETVLPAPPPAPASPTAPTPPKRPPAPRTGASPSQPGSPPRSGYVRF